MATGRVNRGRKHGIGRRLAVKVMVVGAVGLMSLAGTNPVMAASNQDGDSFWTQFTPSADTRLIFVSSSEGDDANNGLTPATPVKTLAKGYELLRNEHPDWMLLKRGDVWVERFPGWAKSGRSENERLIVGAYSAGPARPQVRPSGGNNAISSTGNAEVRHVAFVGLHLEPQSRADGDNPSGVSWLRRTKDILFEDLYVAGFKDNFAIHSRSEATPIENVRLNGCVVVDSWSRTSHSQGLYAKNLDGLLVENCVFASNGFNTDRGAEPTIFNHNIYIQNDTRGVVIRNNIIADASSHGLQLRPGGVAEGNLFLSNPLAIMFGGGTAPDEGGVAGRVSHNTILHGRSLSDSMPRSFGIEVSNIRDAVVESNVLSVSEIGHNGRPVDVATKGSFGVRNLKITNNFIVGWHGAVRIDPPSDGHVFDNNTFVGNYIYRDLLANNGNPNFNRSFVEVFAHNHPGLSINNNTYEYYRVHDRPFRSGGQNLGIDQWGSNVEPSASFYVADAPPPYLTIGSYLQELGRSGGVEEFLVGARQMSRNHVDPAMTATGVHEWAMRRVRSE